MIARARRQLAGVPWWMWLLWLWAFAALVAVPTAFAMRRAGAFAASVDFYPRQFKAPRPLVRGEVWFIEPNPRVKKGTFTLTVGGKTTKPLASNATPAQIQAAVSGLSTVRSGNVLVDGGPLPIKYVELSFFNPALAGRARTFTGRFGGLTGGTYTLAYQRPAPLWLVEDRQHLSGPQTLTYIRGLVRTPFVHNTLIGNGYDVELATLPKRLTIVGGRGFVRLTVRDDSPEHARALADSLGQYIVEADIDPFKAKALWELRVLLGPDGLQSPAFKSGTLTPREHALAVFIRNTQPRMRLRKVGQPPVRGRLDRALSRLPGPFPPHVAPALAAASGAGVALVLCAGSFAYWSRRRRARARPSP